MNELTLPQSKTVTVKGDNIEVQAQTPDEMKQANQALIAWCEHKIKLLRIDHIELDAAFKSAKEKKWKHTTLERQAKICAKRIEFFKKIKTALEHGFYIVPNFPVTVFAIRTDKKKPLKMWTTYQHGTHEQRAPSLTQGEGKYENPFPEIYQHDISSSQDKEKGKQVFNYYAENWQELDFPLTMAKPQIMEAASRTMALKLFDDLGVLPSPYQTKDPIIVARIRDPRSTKYNWRGVSFILAWSLNTETL